MSYQPIAAESFGGLRLDLDPGEAGWANAIDILNVDFEPGVVRSRWGSSSLVDTASTPTGLVANNTHIFTRYGGNLKAYSLTGGAAVATVARAVNYRSIASIGTSAAKAAYLAVGDPDDLAAVVKHDGSTSLAATAFNGTFVALSPVDNRLAVGYTAAAEGSRVKFSDAGDPDTFGANNYVDLYPNDGEVIWGMATYRDLLFVFKQTRFFVFYGNSTDSSGDPVFNYRTVSTGVGLQSKNAVAVGRTGVYFASGDGIYRTDGGPPVKVSRGIAPFFERRPQGYNFFTAGSGALLEIGSMAYANGRVMVAFGTGAGPTWGGFVYNEELDAWTYWGQTHKYVCAAPEIIQAGYQNHFYYLTTGGSKILYYAFGTTDDDGTAITSRYRSGFSDLGTPDLKTIREWRLQGIGSPTFKASHDFGALETGAAVTLGTSPATAEGRYRVARRGRQFSFQVSGTTAWSLNNVVAHVREKRSPGTHGAA